MKPRRIRRQGRARAAILISVALVVGAAGLTSIWIHRFSGPGLRRDGPVDTAAAGPPAPPASFEEGLRAFCSRCHLFPPPDSTVKRKWEKEVRSMVEIAGADAAPGLSIARAIEYFRERAPEELPWPQSHAGRGLVASPAPRVLHVTPVGAPPTPAISSLRLAKLFDDAPPVAIGCDMRHGLVFVQRRVGDRIAFDRIAEVPHPARTAIADLDADGRPDLLLGDDQGLWLWSNLGAARFARRAAYREMRPGWAGRPRGVAVAATAVLDLDNDGLADLMTLHFREPPPVFATSAETAPPEGEDTAPSSRRLAQFLAVPAAARPALWRNEGNGVFAEIAETAGIDRLALHPAPPVAADFDRDGDLDLACVGADSMLCLLWNQGGNTSRRLELEVAPPGRASSCHGAVVELYSGASSRSVSLRGPVGWIGLGALQVADVVRVLWPDGSADNFFDVDLLGPGRLKLVRGVPGS